MIVVVVKFRVLPQRSDEWLTLAKDLTEATRAEPGNITFEWSRSVDDPHEFVLLEAYRDSAAREAHANSQHLKEALSWLPDAIAETPKIVEAEVGGADWSLVAGLEPRAGR